MAQPKPYELADKAIALIAKKAVIRASAIKRRLLVAKFDELNVYQNLIAFYMALDVDLRDTLRQLYTERYTEVYESVQGAQKPRKDLDEIAEIYILMLLSEPNDATHYIYDTEALRKRDRTIEAVNAVDGPNMKIAEINKGIRAWTAMVAWYVDFTADEANIQAMEDAGLTVGVWNTQEDEKVCKICNERDGKVYRLSDIPKKPHLGCRCWISVKQ